MHRIFVFFCILALSFSPLKANTVFSQDGIKLNYDVVKIRTVYIPELKKNVIIWKTTLELINSNKKPVAVTSPCCLYYAYCYLFPNEITAVRNAVSDINISDMYKNYATPKPTMLKAKQAVKNEKYFATYEDVNLHQEVYNLDVKYSF